MDEDIFIHPATTQAPKFLAQTNAPGASLWYASLLNTFKNAAHGTAGST
jgi:hypothetical protein